MIVVVVEKCFILTNHAVPALRYGNWDTKLTYMLQTLEEEDDDGLPDVYPVTKAMQCESQ